MDKEQVKVLDCPLCPEGKMYLMKKPCDDCEHLKVCKYYQEDIEERDRLREELKGKLPHKRCGYCPFIKVVSFTPDSELAKKVIDDLQAKLSHYEDKLDKGKIIEKANL